MTSSRRWRSKSTIRVVYTVTCSAVAFENRFSSTRIPRTPSRRCGSSIAGSVCSATAALAVCQPTPNSTAAAAIEKPVDVHHVPQSDPGPYGQRRPPGDRINVFGPCVHLAQRFRATPSATSEHRHCWHTCDRQIPHHRARPAVADRPHGAARAPRPIRAGLHQQPPLAVAQHLRADDEFGHTDERGRVVSTVKTWTRVSPSADSQMPAEWRGPWPRWWIPISEARTSHRPAPQHAEPVIPLARQDIVPRWSAAASCQA